METRYTIIKFIHYIPNIFKKAIKFAVMSLGFLEFCNEHGYNKEALIKFRKAFDFAERHFSDKKRVSGDSYFDHNVRVAEILADSKAAPEVVIAGMIHSALEYVSKEELEKTFGAEVCKLVRQEELLKRIKPRGTSFDPDALRKILVTTLEDVRAVLVKLANKLDNMKDIHVLPQDEQKRIAEEILDVYAPLAYRLGMEKIKIQLEDLAFRAINPRKYNEIEKFLEKSSEKLEQDISDSINCIKSIVVDEVLLVDIKGRPKQIYSIYRKITQRKVKLEDQHDLMGIRIIVPEVKDCYSLLALLHKNFEPVEGKLKDYIANPKPNFYRSIHTTLWLRNGRMFEVQVRTPEMDEFAEEGLAAHWRYKGVKSDEFFEKKMSWLRTVLEMQKDNQEFLETAQIDVFGDKIHCYTPTGDVKELPFEATILDFAYLIHEEVGNKAIGGKVNGKFVPLRHQLRKGDVVEIITNKRQRPRRSWLKIVKSGSARQKIRRSLKESEKGFVPFYFRLLHPDLRGETGLLAESASFPKATCILAKCCHALPGEPIVGIATKRRVISVHRNDCRAALKDEERWIGVSWRNTFSQKIRFNVRAEERRGLLADLLHTIAAARFEVKEAKAKLVDNDMAECSFLIVPKDLEELKSLIAKINNVSGIKKIYFE